MILSLIIFISSKPVVDIVYYFYTDTKTELCKNIEEGDSEEEEEKTDNKEEEKEKDYYKKNCIEACSDSEQTIFNKKAFNYFYNQKYTSGYHSEVLIPPPEQV